MRTDTTTFTRDPDADLNGTSLRAYLDGVERAQMIAVFGPPNEDSYYDDEEGYDAEWTFSASDGRVFNVYPRWEAFRVGAHGPCEDFVAWLRGKLAGRGG